MNRFDQSFDKVFNDNEDHHQTSKRDRELNRTRKQEEKSASTKSREKTFIQSSMEKHSDNT